MVEVVEVPQPEQLVVVEQAVAVVRFASVDGGGGDGGDGW